MARIARVVAPGLPHHITQRGNRRQPTFFSDDDYEAYLALMAEWCRTRCVGVWAYCLMPNHVHIIAAPRSEDGLRRAIGEAHRRYTRRVNFREGWRGHLWQGRFASVALDDAHLRAAARYVAQNPVRAGLARRVEDWRWSSAGFHLGRRASDPLADASALLDHVPDFAEIVRDPLGDQPCERLRRHERTGRPLGDASFVRRLSRRLGRDLVPRPPGPKPTAHEEPG
ncbi:transposase [Candidatus Sumerlaeota bacterium]